MQDEGAHSSWSPQVSPARLVVLTRLYTLIMNVTAAQYMADTVDYASSIRLLWAAGVGFLGIRPPVVAAAGVPSYRAAAPLFEQRPAQDPRAAIVTILIAWNWLAGLVVRWRSIAS